jgi:hypothetical protein
MNEEEIYKWILENFEIGKDPGFKYVFNLIPKTEIGEMLLDEEVREGNIDEIRFTKLYAVNRITDFLYKFYNVDPNITTTVLKDIATYKLPMK